MKSSSSFPGLIFLVILAIGAVVALPLHRHGSTLGAAATMVVTILCASIVSSAIRVADPWT